MIGGECLEKVPKSAKDRGYIIIPRYPSILPPSKVKEETAGKKARKKIPRTVNRKRITKDSTITVNEKTYPINTGKGEKKNQLGVYVEIIYKMIEQLQVAQGKWGGRVFGLRQELHMPHTTENNKVISLFISRLTKRLKREYGFKEIGYAWAREYHGLAKSQHYHIVIFLDGRKVRHPKKVGALVREMWAGSSRAEIGYSMGRITDAFYFVDSDDVAADFVKRFSYLAKCRGKGARPPQTKDYGCSRMKPMSPKVGITND